jgi:DNA-binding MarR family transcriptional regulator
MSPRPPRDEDADVSKEPPIQLGALQESVGFFLLRASRKLAHEWTNRRQEKEHRPLFYFAFTLIGANPGISPAHLARFLVLDKSRASDLIDTLEAQQCITRRRQSEDHRRQGIYLTPTGTTRLAAILAQMQAEDQRIHGLLSEDERRQLIGLLGRIAAAS